MRSQSCALGTEFNSMRMTGAPDLPRWGFPLTTADSPYCDTNPDLLVLTCSQTLALYLLKRTLNKRVLAPEGGETLCPSARVQPVPVGENLFDYLFTSHQNIMQDSSVDAFAFCELKSCHCLPHS